MVMVMDMSYDRIGRGHGKVWIGYDYLGRRSIGYQWRHTHASHPLTTYQS